MKKIKLTQGKVALVDDEDFVWLRQYKWHFDATTGYARTSRPRKIYMHRLINKTPKGFLTDHKDRDRLNNQKANLWTVDSLRNGYNKELLKTNTSGHVGVSWTKNIKKWESYIWKNNIKIKIGYFEKLEDACLAREMAVKKHYV